MLSYGYTYYINIASTLFTPSTCIYPIFVYIYYHNLHYVVVYTEEVIYSVLHIYV